MYAWDPAAAKWNQLTPSVFPTCVIEGEMTWQSSNNTILYTGGVCATPNGTEESYEWDGTNWTKIDLTHFAGGYFGSALTFDPDHQNAVLFGGASPRGRTVTATFTYANKAWSVAGDAAYPLPRSLFTFTTDPVNKVVYLFGGVNELHLLRPLDLSERRSVRDHHEPAHGLRFADRRLRYRPLKVGRSLFRQRDVGVRRHDVDEFDATKNAPPATWFASLVYDQTLKKTVFFGGLDGNTSTSIRPGPSTARPGRR